MRDFAVAVSEVVNEDHEIKNSNFKSSNGESDFWGKKDKLWYDLILDQSYKFYKILILADNIYWAPLEQIENYFPCIPDKR